MIPVVQNQVTKKSGTGGLKEPAVEKEAFLDLCLVYSLQPWRRRVVVMHIAASNRSLLLFLLLLLLP